MPGETQEKRDTNVSWFLERPRDNQISPDARRLLEKYSRIPADQVINHVVSVRDEAWKTFPYPCLGQFRFLDLSLKHYDQYEEILERLGRGQRLLDMGCCFGQELRQLAADGIPSENLYGCDLIAEYIELGYKLFQDRNRIGAHFLSANIFDNESALSKFTQEIDIVYCGSFFHLFGYEDQVTASKVVAALLRPQKGSMLLGRQVGATRAVEVDNPVDPKRKTFCHDADSFKSMWADIGSQLGVKFTVHITLTSGSTPDPEMRWLHFVVTRE
ncbi:hypothetical protein CC80DRAFT_20847 [Byssothecium circinans]|uniref:Methyltransferase domain-containing protein n=1 Tax=Byssothecium circinans TaxID=147558 RepID=A0A6A5U7G7_9PLEO|nr:hypothetical protein CC80DRAFT_20847 [Byssothecium circinans]